jgi:hypothetical protein
MFIKEVPTFLAGQIEQVNLVPSFRKKELFKMP